MKSKHVDAHKLRKDEVITYYVLDDQFKNKINNLLKE